MHTIEPLTHPVTERDLHALANLLIDAVDSGAAVSFLAPLPLERSLDWWRQAIAKLSADPASPTILVARDARANIVGSVQLHPAWAPNQPHRGDVGKLLVHRSARGTGLGRALMQHIERAARERGLSILTLDCKSGGVAEHLYRSLNWVHSGTIPNYALDPDGKALHATEVFYKSI